MYLICTENGGIRGVSRPYSRHTAPLVMSPSAQLVWLLADYAGVLFGAGGQQRTTTELMPPQNPYREIIEKGEPWPIARMPRSTKNFNQRRQRVFRPTGTTRDPLLSRPWKGDPGQKAWGIGQNIQHENQAHPRDVFGDLLVTRQ